MDNRLLMSLLALSKRSDKPEPAAVTCSATNAPGEWVYFGGGATLHRFWQ